MSARADRLERLKYFLSLEEGWCGCGTYPMDRSSYCHMKEVIESMDEDRLAQWGLFLGLSGSYVFLSARRGINATIYIGPENFTYSAVTSQESSFIGEEKPYSLEAVMDAIEKIYTFLKDEFQEYSNKNVPVILEQQCPDEVKKEMTPTTSEPSPDKVYVTYLLYADKGESTDYEILGVFRDFEEAKKVQMEEVEKVRKIWNKCCKDGYEEFVINRPGILIYKYFENDEGLWEGTVWRVGIEMKEIK